MAVIPFATGSHVVDSLAIDTEELVNLYAEISETGKSVLSLHLRPGLTLQQSYGRDVLRGIILTGDSDSGFVLYGVNYRTLFRQAADQPPETVGLLDSTENRVHMAWNGRDLLVTDGTDGYAYRHDTATFQKLGVAEGWALTQPTFCTYLAQYLIVLDREDSSYNISGLRDAFSWDATDKAFAESDPDGVVNIQAYNGELWIFGTRTVEVHYNSGDATFPFAPKLSATLEWGTPAPDTVADFDNGIAFLAQSARGGMRVFTMQGYQAQRISDAAFEARLRELDVSNASAFGFDWQGHAFYLLTFPESDQSWMYDSHSQQWTAVNSAGGRYVGQWAVGREGITLVTDYRDGTLYRISDSQADGTTPIYVRAVGKTINDEEQIIDHASLQIVCEHGTAAQATDPQIQMRWSNDNGFTWSASYWRSLGRVGNYRTRARWNRLGRARNRTYEAVITDAAPKRIVGMVLNRS